MSTSLLYHTQGISGFQHQSYKYEEGKVIQRICRKTFYCDECSSQEVSIFPTRTRKLHCGNIGRKLLIIEVKVHRIYCRNCKAFIPEKLPYLSHRNPASVLL